MQLVAVTDIVHGTKDGSQIHIQAGDLIDDYDLDQETEDQLLEIGSIVDLDREKLSSSAAAARPPTEDEKRLERAARAAEIVANEQQYGPSENYAPAGSEETPPASEPPADGVVPQEPLNEEVTTPPAQPATPTS